MLHAKRQTTNSETKRRTSTYSALVISLIVFGVLVIASLGMSSRSVGAASDRGTNQGAKERINFRQSERQRVSASNTRMLTPTPLITIDVDRTDDDALAAACTVAPNDCSLRGAVTFANLVPGTVINVPAGTYQLSISGAGEGFSGNNLVGDLDVSGNNTSIVGAGAATTIIQQTQPNDRVLEVNPFLDASFNFNISGVTISGGRETTGVGGGGIISGAIGNTMSVTNCVISGNSATGTGTLGGGGISHVGGNLTVTGTTFSGNSTSTSGGGLGYSAGDPLNRRPSNGTLTVSGSTFSGNTANSVAAGGGGADLFNFNGSIGAYNINSSTFSGNTAPTGRGGAIVVESGPLTLTTSSLSGNSAGVAGGAIYSGGSASVAYSRLVANSVPNPLNGLTLFYVSTSFTANDNWWGIDTGPSANDFRNPGGSVSPITHLQLRMIADPSQICTGGASTLTADIKQRNAGAPLTTELNGLPSFPAIFSNAVLGSVSGATNFVDGVATATFTAGGTTGSGGADVTADNQTASATVSIEADSTTDPSDQIVCEGQTATFTTTSSAQSTVSFVWKKGATVLNNGDLGGRVTITSGSNTSTLSISNTAATDADTYTVDAISTCNPSSQSATLSVQPPTATTDPADVTECQGEDAHFSTTASGTGPFSYAWTLDGAPYNGNSPSITIPTGSLSPGNHMVQVTTTGSCGSATQTATLTVGGAPQITFHTTTTSMWPPNHQYRTFNVSDFVSGASSTCDPNVDIADVVIQNVTSDEPENGPGADGNTLNDIVIAPDCKSVDLRSERDGNLNGRVYTITFKVTDSFGNSSTATVTVTVPTNNGGGAVDSGAAAGYTVNSLCP